MDMDGPGVEELAVFDLLLPNDCSAAVALKRRGRLVLRQLPISRQPIDADRRLDAAANHGSRRNGNGDVQHLRSIRFRADIDDELPF
jgi:hypothetical protein